MRTCVAELMVLEDAATSMVMLHSLQVMNTNVYTGTSSFSRDTMRRGDCW
jgi:hypothetical protein